jgi:hypothetical protein
MERISYLDRAEATAPGGRGSGICVSPPLPLGFGVRGWAD